MIKDKNILARMSDEDLRTPSHDAIMIWLHENIAAVSAEISAGIERHPDYGVVPMPTAEDITVKWESPVWGGGYLKNHEIIGARHIIGYIDLLAEFSSNVCLPHIAFEVKTSIRSIGETIRQINTYRAHIRRETMFCIVSPDDRFRAILESQGILFVKAPAVGDSSAQGGLF